MVGFQDMWCNRLKNQCRLAREQIFFNIWRHSCDGHRVKPNNWENMVIRLCINYYFNDPCPNQGQILFGKSRDQRRKAEIILKAEPRATWKHFDGNCVQGPNCKKAWGQGPSKTQLWLAKGEFVLRTPLYCRYVRLIGSFSRDKTWYHSSLSIEESVHTKSHREILNMKIDVNLPNNTNHMPSFWSFPRILSFVHEWQTSTWVLHYWLEVWRLIFIFIHHIIRYKMKKMMDSSKENFRFSPHVFNEF